MALLWLLHNYHSSHRILPSGYAAFADYARIGSLPASDWDAVTWDAAPGWGWGTLISPYIEQANLEFDDRLPVWHPSHREQVVARLPIYLCPSASGGNEAFVVMDAAGSPLLKDGQQVRLARSHYAASHGQQEAWGAVSGPPGEVDLFGNPIIHPPNYPTLHVGQMYSEHPGGANVLLADGSVRFIAETIFRPTFAALSSIAQGEVVGDY